MENLEESIRKVASRLLNEEKVELIIGYKQGTLPLYTTPCFVDKAEDVQKLVWNECCDINLTRYLLSRNERIGIIAKGCDARLITVCCVEHQIPRENIIIIGVACKGVIDKKKIDDKLEGKEVIEAFIDDEDIKLRGEGFELSLPKKDFLSDSCITCKHKNPPIHDIFIGEKTQEIQNVDEFDEVNNIESKSTNERWEHFEKELSNCIRCYACRNVCPLCYCKTCFVDQTLPTWFGKTSNVTDTMIYHVVRAFHMAGRCVDCGACSRVCPMNINLRELMKKIEKIMKEKYDHEAGLSLDQTPPLGEFKMEDSQEFIK